jgi:hypothetical protein
MEKVVGIFKLYEVDALTRWRDAHRMVLESEAWREDKELSQLPQLDILLAFEDYSKIKSGEYESTVKIAEMARMQKNRLAREAFRVSCHQQLFVIAEMLSRHFSKSSSPLKSSPQVPSGKKSILCSRQTRDISIFLGCRARPLWNCSGMQWTN